MLGHLLELNPIVCELFSDALKSYFMKEVREGLKMKFSIFPLPPPQDRKFHLFPLCFNPFLSCSHPPFLSLSYIFLKNNS